MDQIPLQEDCYYHIYNRANGSDNLFRGEKDYLHFLELYQKYILPVADSFAWVLMANHFHLLVRIKEGMYYKHSKEDFKNDTASNAVRSAIADADGLGEAVRFEDVKWETIAVNPSPPNNPSASAGPDGIVVEKANGIVEESDGIVVEESDNIAKRIRKKANPIRHFSHLFNAYAKYINDRHDRHGSLFQRPFKRKQVETENYLRRLVVYIHNNPVHHGFVGHLSDYPWSSYHQYLSEESTGLCKGETLDWFGDMQHFIAAHHQYAGSDDPESWLEED